MAVLVTASCGLPDLRHSDKCGPRAGPRSGAIHDLFDGTQTWMAGTSPAMTGNACEGALFGRGGEENGHEHDECPGQPK
jgi:hypothetical protein